MLVVTFNLVMRTRFFTWIHAVSIIGSLLSYIIYMWIGNFLSADISRTHHAVEQVHLSPIFYLRIACCIAATFCFDYAVECWRVCITENPTDFLRCLINRGESIENPENRDKFQQLVAIEDDKARERLSQ